MVNPTSALPGAKMPFLILIYTVYILVWLSSHMTDNELAKALADHKAAIVHFSHHANMREGGVFPIDLQNAISKCCQWPLSCCVVLPGHQMDLPGSVGVLFEPLAKQVLSVLHDDSGSATLPNGDDISDGASLSKESFDNSLAVMPGRYNEWRLQCAKVIGIYVDNPSIIRVKQKQTLQTPLGPTQYIAHVQVGLAFVKRCFPEQKFYTMSTCGLVEI